MAFTRSPRFRRSSGVHAIQLTARDQQIMQLVREHRFLRSSHIFLLIGESKQQISRRLQLLYQHGYLERPRSQLDYYAKGGSRPIIYGLGNKEAAEVGTPKTPYGEKNRSV